MTSKPTYPDTAAELERFWQGHVAQWRASGQTQIGYCRSRGLSVHRLRWWKAKLERRRAGAEGPALIPVQVQAPLPEAGRSRGESGVRVWLGEGLCVEVAVGFDPATLGAVVQVLGP
ncbi:MAG: IS66 family insertion sequence element accessory protein TnpB [Pseudomonadota bacterium]|nr:IS66 family insertion sequence element accessory protein TnpB [Pseudomonadota bacterium]